MRCDNLAPLLYYCDLCDPIMGENYEGFRGTASVRRVRYLNLMATGSARGTLGQLTPRAELSRHTLDETYVVEYFFTGLYIWVENCFAGSARFEPLEPAAVENIRRKYQQ